VTPRRAFALAVAALLAIVAVASLGTYEVSKGPEICDLLGPPRPATHARLDQILAEEAKLPVDRLVAACLEDVRPERFKADPVPGSLPPETAR